MMNVHSRILHVLLLSLLDQGLISAKMYEAAEKRLHCGADPLTVLRDPDHREGEGAHGCS